MNEIEVETKPRFFELRLISVLILFLVLYILLLSRAFQLQIIAGESLKSLVNQQHARALETRELITDLQHSFDKLSTEQKKIITDTITLGVEKETLQKEIDELKPKYNKLYNDVQLLQKKLKDLSILQEKEMDQIIKIFEQNSIKQKWPNLFMSFIVGILTSIIASAIYNSVAIRNKISSMGKIIKDRIIHLKK
jgi:predicted nuclease with TOPRIM domain